MKKIIFAIIICVTTSFVGCSPQKDSRVAINFGEAQYKEPFRGILASKPDILVKSLDWPVIKLFKPDTAIVCRTIEFSFNEDAVRSNAIAEISLLGTSFQPNSNIQWYVNNTPLIDGKFTIKATLEPQQVKLKGKIHPIVGNTKLEGYLTLSSTDLDEVNSIQLTSDINSIADWTCTHEYGWPILLWLIWILMVLLVIVFVILLIGVLLRGISYVVKCLAFNHNEVRNSNVTKNNGETTNNNKDKKRRYWWIEYRCFVYVHSKTIHKRSVNLFKLMVALENLKKRNFQGAEEAYMQLPIVVQDHLDQLWEKTNSTYGDATRKTIYAIPKSSVFTYSTDNGEKKMSYKDAVKLYQKDFRSFHLKISNRYYFNHGRLDLSNIAIAKVKINYEITNCDRYGKNGIQPLSESLFMADKRFVKKMRKMGYDNFWYFLDGKKKNLSGKERFDRKTPLVIHEDPDCQTLYLVPSFLHQQIKHYGGIAMAGIVRIL